MGPVGLLSADENLKPFLTNTGAFDNLIMHEPTLTTSISVVDEVMVRKTCLKVLIVHLVLLLQL